MFGNLFGSKKPSGAKKPTGSNPTAPAKAPAAPKLRKVNIEKRFTIIAEAKQGSMSRVFKALDNESGRSICLKIQDAAKSAAAASRTTREGRLNEGDIGLRISHPNVVRTFEQGLSTAGAHFIVMEFIDGVSLQYLRQSRVLSLADKLDLLAQAADGLAAVHASGFIHHDYGPKNLMVDRDNRVKLIDFGLAVPNTAAFHRPGNRTGTLQYMAPEVIRREPTNERLDIFGYGVTAFELLTNRLPYDATDPMAMMRQRINSNPTDIDVYAPKLPDELKDLIRKLLTKSPRDRWPTMSTVADALRAVPIPA